MTLKEPYGMVLESLGKTGSSIAAIMREKEALTDPQHAGQGGRSAPDPSCSPRTSGCRAARRSTSSTRTTCRASEPPSAFAGGKFLGVDRIELVWISDPQTAMSALVNGEIDFFENPSIDFLPLLEKAKGVKLLKTGKMDARRA